MELQLIGVAPR